MTCPAGVQIAQGRADNAAVTSVHHPAVGCAALLAFALAAVPAIGQERQPPPEPASLTRLSLEELGDLPVVSVSKTPHEAWATAAAIVVLTADDIRRSGATSVPEALRLVPGVQVSRIDTTHWAVGIRGVTSQFSKALLVLVDGRSVYTPLFGGVYWDVQDLLLGDVDRIEVIRGPAGTIWGANAIQGVINIITKDARQTAGPLVTGAAGNVDQAAGGVRYGGTIGASTGYRVFVHGFKRGPQSHQDDGNFDRWTAGRAGFRVDGGDGPVEFSVQGAAYGGDPGERVAIGSFDPPAQRDVDGPDQVAGGHVLGRWRRSFATRGSLQVQGYFDRTSRRAPHYREVRNTFDVDLIHRLPLPGRHALSWGAGARVSPARVTQLVPTLTFTDLTPTDHVYSAFVQDEFQLRPDVLVVTAGVKLEHQAASGVELQPSVRAIWRPNRRHALWGAVTRAVRTPAHLDRALVLTGMLQADPAIFLRIAGNPDLDPERSIGVEAGTRHLLTPELSIEVAAFRTSYTGLQSFGPAAITAETDPIPHALVTFPYVNGMSGAASGVEIAPAWQPSRTWQARAGYSYLHIGLANTPASPDTTSVTTTEESSPRHQLFAQSVLFAGAAWEFVQTYRFVSALPAQGVEAMHALDLRAAWRAGRTGEVAVQAHNVLQDAHVEFDHPAGSPAVAIRRSVTASFVWRP